MTPDLTALRKHLPGQDDVDAPLVLEIDLARGLLDGPPTDPLAALRGIQIPVLTEVVAGLRRAARDPHVAGVVVHVTPRVTVAQVEEVGLALRELGESGRATIAWTESFGELGPGTVPYYLAAHCDEIWLQPSGTVGLTGVSVDVMLLRGVLDKVGAEPQLGQRHEYKSAAETFMRTEVSGPNREMTQRLADSVVEQVSAVVRRSRSLDEAAFAGVLAAAPVSAADAVERRLVDHLGYRDDVYADVRRRLGEGGRIRLQFAHRYARHQASKARRRPRRRRHPAIAMVPVRGGIVPGPGGSPGPGRAPSAGSDTVCAALRAAADDKHIRAVVLRVDSPGGSYIASDAIRRAVLDVRGSGKPVVASMGRLAASGGYFVSMPADEIVALPGTLTGSIGVLGGKVVLAETMQKIGVTRETIASGEHAGMFSTTRGFGPGEWQRVEGWLDDVYADFTEKAAKDRGLPLDRLEPLARGRVWTGADARDRGLVDSMGGLSDAVTVACRRAGVDREKARMMVMPHVSPLQRLRPPNSSESPAASASASPDRWGLTAAVVGSLSSGVPEGDLDVVGQGLGWLLQALGIPRTGGVLSLPWALEFR